MRGVVWCVLFLVVEPTLAGVAYATTSSTLTPDQPLPSSSNQQSIDSNIRILREVWMKSKLFAELPEANIKNPLGIDGPTEIGLKLVNSLPQPFVHLMGSDIVGKILKDASNHADEGFRSFILGNRTIEQARPTLKDAIKKNLDLAEKSIPLLMGVYLQSKNSSRVSVGEQFLGRLAREVTQQLSNAQTSSTGMHAGRPLASQGTKASLVEKGAIVGFMVLFALAITLVPIFEYAVVKGSFPSPMFPLQNYSARTVFTLFQFFSEYIFVMFALCFAFFHKITSLSHEYEQSHSSGAAYYGHLFVVVLLPLAFIISVATGVAQPNAFTEAQFSIHLVISMFLTLPVLLIMVLLLKTLRLTNKDETFLKSLKSRFSELVSPYQTRDGQQKLSEEDIREMRTLLSWYGDINSDMSVGFSGFKNDVPLSSGSPGGKTTFESAVFSGNCRLMDSLVTKYQDELKAIACNGHSSPQCKCEDVKKVSPEMVDSLRSLYSLPKFFSFLQTWEPSAHKVDSNGHVVKAFDDSQQQLDPTEIVDMKSRTAAVDTNFFAITEPLSLPSCDSMLQLGESQECKFAKKDNGEGFCPCNLLLDTKQTELEANCLDFCRYACVAQEVVKYSYGDIEDHDRRAKMPEVVEDITDNYLAYFLCLALILAAIGRFFGVSGECGPLMTTSGDISQYPHCSIVDSASQITCGGKAFPRIENAKEWRCSSDSTKTMREGSSCVLICEEGYTPKGGITQCVSGGFLLTYWTHLKGDYTYDQVTCEIDYDVCRDMIASLVATKTATGTYALSNEATLSQTVPTTFSTDGTVTPMGVSLGVGKSIIVTSTSLTGDSGSVFFRIEGFSSTNPGTQYLVSFKNPDQTGDDCGVVFKDGKIFSVSAETKTFAPSFNGPVDFLVTWETDPFSSTTSNRRLVYIYVNGVLMKETEMLLSSSTKGIQIIIGNNAKFEHPLSGTLRNFRVWKSKLVPPTAADLQYSSLCPVKWDSDSSAISSNSNAAVTLPQTDSMQVPISTEEGSIPSISTGELPPVASIGEVNSLEEKKSSSPEENVSSVNSEAPQAQVDDIEENQPVLPPQSDSTPQVEDQEDVLAKYMEIKKRAAMLKEPSL